MQTLTLRQRILVVIFFGLIAISVMSPIASDRKFPFSFDYGNHASAIVLAGMAIDEGQFPIRVAPYEHNGWRYPLFQFYSPLPYIVAGTIYKVYHSAFSQGLTFNYSPSPLIAFKLTLWLSLLIAGIYVFRLISWLTFSRQIALLAGVLYIYAPYLLININIRGAFTEALAQGLIPFALYYTIRSFFEESKNLKFAILTSFAWFAICTTHLITFVYSSLFIGLFLLFLCFRNLSQWKNLIRVGLMYSFGCLLAFWYLIPIALITPYLNVSDGICYPFNFHYLTPLTALLSVNSVSTLPLANSLDVYSLFCPSLGWPILIGAGFLCYLLVEKKLILNNRVNQIIKILLLLFFLSFFATWSPINFWKFFPKILSIAQFCYRMEAQTSWIGTLLFGFALFSMGKDKINNLHVIIGILLIGLASSSWLISNRVNPIETRTVKSAPDMGNARNDYLLNQKSIKNILLAGNIALPLIEKNFWLDRHYDWLDLNQEMILPANFLNNPSASLNLIGKLPQHMSNKPITLIFQLDGQNKVSKILKPGNFEWIIPIGKLVKSYKKEVHISFIVDNPIIRRPLDQPEYRDELSILIDSLSFNNLLANPEFTALNVSDTRARCTQKRTETICNITVPPQAHLVQLPILYYPKLLDVKVNGKSIEYLPLSHKDLVLTGLRLQPGNYEISVDFVGIRWTNWISGIAWIVLIGFLLALMISKIEWLIKFQFADKKIN